jgi:hypothetical protein
MNHTVWDSLSGNLAGVFVPPFISGVEHVLNAATLKTGGLDSPTTTPVDAVYLDHFLRRAQVTNNSK